MSTGGGRVFLTVDEPDGWAVWITEDTEIGHGVATTPSSSEDAAPLPAEVSHLLAADDALIPGRWGAHATLCGQEVRRPAVEHDDPLGCPCFRYCPECVREAVRWSAEITQPDRGSEVR